LADSFHPDDGGDISAKPSTLTGVIKRHNPEDGILQLDYSSSSPWPLVCERTVPTERPPLVDEIQRYSYLKYNSTQFTGQKIQYNRDQAYVTRDDEDDYINVSGHQLQSSKQVGQNTSVSVRLTGPLLSRVRVNTRIPPPSVAAGQ
jgi:hypothetical protein